MATRVGDRTLGASGSSAGLRLPPHSVEAEQSVLGGLMLDSAAWDQVADRVVAEDFYRNDHRLIFEAVAGLIERNQPCDAVTLSGHLESQGVLDQVGGLAYLGSLARDTPTSANIRAYADIVRERSVLPDQHGGRGQLVHAGEQSPPPRHEAVREEQLEGGIAEPVPGLRFPSRHEPDLTVMSHWVIASDRLMTQ